MPRISDTLVKSIVYLYATLEDAQNARASGATGFLIGVPYERKFDETRYHHTYLVTNEHVVHGGIKAARLNRKDGGSDCLFVNDSHWYFHPDGDDVAVAVVNINFNVHDHLLNVSNMFITREFIEEHDIGMGDDAYIVGRFRYHEGRKRNLPSARFGNIAQMPNEPILVERATNYIAMQDAFLVEMRSISGYSGSPVFLYVPPFTYRATKNPKGLDGEYHTRLLGVDMGHLKTKDKVVDADGNKVNGFHVESNSAMTAVIPAWKIQEILDMDELAKDRKKVESEHAKLRESDGASGIVPDSISDDDVEDNNPPLTREEFERILRKATRPIDEDEK